MSAERSVSRLTPRSTKVLAHPLRSRLLSALRRNGPATATDLAAELHTNTGATSYHLRKMAEVDLVVDTGEGEGKRRLWRAAAEMTSWFPSELADEDSRAAMDWLQREYARQRNDQYAAWLDVAEEWPLAWQDASGSSDDAVFVTPEQLEQLRHDLWELVQSYREVGHGHPAARRVHVDFNLVPMDLDQAPPV